MAQESSAAATGMTLAAVVIGLSITEEMTAADQNAVANLLLAAAQAISTRASLLPEGTSSRRIFERVDQIERQMQEE